MLKWYEIIAIGCAIGVSLILVIMTLLTGYLDRKNVNRLKDKGVIK